MRDLIIKQNHLSLLNIKSGYDILEFAFANYMYHKSFLDRFYIAIFDAKHSKEEKYHHFCELFELNQDYEIIWQIDWCEGETDIKNIKFYSLLEIDILLKEGIKNED